MLRQVIVNFTSDSSTALSGVLWQTRGPWLVFRDCALLKAGQPPTKMDGDAVIHRDQISFIQVLP